LWEWPGGSSRELRGGPRHTPPPQLLLLHIPAAAAVAAFNHAENIITDAISIHERVQRRQRPRATGCVAARSPALRANCLLTDDLRDMAFDCNLLIDPVVAADGYTYERESIERWLKSHLTSPTTNEPLAHKFLNANLDKRQQVVAWCEANRVPVPLKLAKYVSVVQKPMVTCPRHPREQLRVFCRDCSHAVCVLCAVDFSVCKLHATVPLEPLLDQMKAEIQVWELAQTECNRAAEELVAAIRSDAEAKKQAYSSGIDAEVETMLRSVRYASSQRSAAFGRIAQQLLEMDEKLANACTCAEAAVQDSRAAAIISSAVERMKTAVPPASAAEFIPAEVPAATLGQLVFADAVVQLPQLDEPQQLHGPVHPPIWMPHEQQPWQQQQQPHELQQPWQQPQQQQEQLRAWQPQHQQQEQLSLCQIQQQLQEQLRPWQPQHQQQELQQPWQQQQQQQEQLRPWQPQHQQQELQQPWQQPQQQQEQLRPWQQPQQQPLQQPDFRGPPGASLLDDLLSGFGAPLSTSAAPTTLHPPVIYSTRDVEVRGHLVRLNRESVYQMVITNHMMRQSLSGFAVKFNKNLFSIASGSMPSITGLSHFSRNYVFPHITTLAVNPGESVPVSFVVQFGDISQAVMQLLSE
jgi:hypothetical protein